MRNGLLQLIQQTIVFQYDLPHSTKGIQKTIFSTDRDKCYLANNIDGIIKVIYNSVVEYSFNEFEITQNTYENLHAIALKTKIKYNLEQSPTVKLKYGFFGEVLLYAVLCVLFKVKPLISRGYFYNPLEDAETKGYDSYHLVENNGRVELWFGEIKFRSSHESGIRSALSNIKRAVSDDYLNKNLLALTSRKKDFNYQGSKIENIVNDWEQKPNIRIIDYANSHNIKLIYPVMIVYESDEGDYDSDIKKVPEYINNNFKLQSFNISIPYSIFFIFLPLKKVKKIKSEVIRWIESKKPLMS